MKSLVVFLALTVAFASAMPNTKGGSDSDSSKAPVLPLIVGDEGFNIAPPGTLRYQLSLQIGGNHVCGAVIYNENWALTAASCLPDCIKASEVTLVAGAHNLAAPESSAQIRQGKTIIRHADFNRNRSTNDIALIQFSSSLGMTPSVQPILLYASNKPVAATPLQVSGWGLTGPKFFSNLLKVATTTVQPDAACIAIFRRSVARDTLCGGITAGVGLVGQDVCEGDYGGPLVLPDNVNGQLVGIASNGLKCQLGANAPVLYTYVPQFATWIRAFAD